MIWLPQNMDFRGRVYPVPPHITHLGADFYRSLFLFAKGKELGPSGLDWLKVKLLLCGTLAITSPARTYIILLGCHITHF